MLRLPLPRQLGLAIPEKSFRLLVAALIGVFLTVLGAVMAQILLESRTAHIESQTRLAALQGAVAAQNIRLAFEPRSGQTPPPMTSGLLLQKLPADALKLPATFVIADASGLITASQPPVAEKMITERLSADFVTSVGESRTASGEAAFVGIFDLGAYPGSLFVIQKKADILSIWHGSVAKLAVIFVLALIVLAMLGAALQWQAAKVAEADSVLAAATTRLDKALDRGQCGMWDWDVAKGVMFWSKSMFEILGLPVKGDFLSFGEVAARIHPDDAKLEHIIENLLRGELAVFDREFRMRHEDGHWVWLRARVALAGTARDRAEAARR